jgi:hypothetical protein
MAGGNCMVILRNNTIAYNSTDSSGGGIATNGSGKATFSGENNIIYANSSSDRSEIAAVQHGGETKLTYSCITTYRDIAGKGNIYTDPLFVNAEKDDFRLKKNSPCINAGNPDSPDNYRDREQDGTSTNMGAL